jgi:hypothetical protein
MTSQNARRAATGRLVVIVCAGLAVAAGLAWPSAIAAQPATKTAPASAAAQPAAKAGAAQTAAQPAAKAGSPSDRQKKATEGASLRDYVLVKSSLDRSAIWIGDRFAFIVDVECSRGTDILTDDLSRDRLQLDELEILGVDQTRDDRGDGRIAYRFTYHLTTYSLEPSAKRIGEMRLRYYVRRPGQRPDEIEPAGEVLVPAAMVFIRSLLPDDPSFAKYRNERPVVPRAAALAMLERIGIGLVIVSIVPAAMWLVAVVRRVRHRRHRQSVRKLRHDERASLDDLRALDVGAEAGRKEAYDHMSALVRKHVTGAWGVGAEGLSAAEIASALAADGKAEVSAEVTSFLDACEKARYGKPEELPSREACLAAIDRAEHLVGLGRS